MTDDEYFKRFEEELIRLAANYRAFLKAGMIGITMLVSSAIISGSFSKAVLISFLCFLLACFATWRRFLEPISFLVFCIAVAMLFDIRLPDLRTVIGK